MVIIWILIKTYKIQLWGLVLVELNSWGKGAHKTHQSDVRYCRYKIKGVLYVKLKFNFDFTIITNSQHEQWHYLSKQMKLTSIFNLVKLPKISMDEWKLSLCYKWDFHIPGSRLWRTGSRGCAVQCSDGNEWVSTNGGTDDTDVWVAIRRGPRRQLRE